MKIRVTHVPFGSGKVREVIITLGTDPNAGITPHVLSEVMDSVCREGPSRILELTETDAHGFPLRDKLPGERPNPR